LERRNPKTGVDLSFSMQLPIVHHPDYTAHDVPADHRFPMQKFRRVAEVLIEEGLVRRDGFHVPAPVDRHGLMEVHDGVYVDGVLDGVLPDATARKIGFAMTPAIARRARLATGGTILTAELALKHGIACNTAGGSHHADRDGGAGFCVFNDVAVAARSLQARGLAEKVLTIDLDVHQGDGTARIFDGDPTVFTLSVHCEKNFPARKARSDRDVGLPAGTSDNLYLEALDLALSETLDNIRPDIVFFNAGVDVHADDRLGLLALTDEGIAARDAMVISRVRALGLPLAGVLGGGYASDIDALARLHVSLHRTAARFV
jgi:acetoin utilization deacetylase AcuC-like enzyme